MQIVLRRNLVSVDKDELTELQRREKALRDALTELLAAWPSDSLPPHWIAMKAANAINNVTG